MLGDDGRTVLRAGRWEVGLRRLEGGRARLKAAAFLEVEVAL
jgi:hypothetical protein